MTHLFSHDGDRALDAALSQRALLALDFDGTLAPIVADPAAARAPARVARLLAHIAQAMPVAIVTGRAIADVRTRIAFEPHYLVGNHGAEGLPGHAAPHAQAASARWREAIAGPYAHALRDADVLVEDKGHSLSLHYRGAPDQPRARAAIRQVVDALDPAPRVIDGHCVVNLIAHDAPDKFLAVRALALHAQCESVIFVGDDVTDEIVFEAAPAHWLTVRVAPQGAHHARFHLDRQAEVQRLLVRVLRRVRRAAASPESASERK